MAAPRRQADAATVTELLGSGGATVDGVGLEHLPATASAEEIHAILHRDAALIIDDLADIDSIDRITAEMAPFIEATPAGSEGCTTVAAPIDPPRRAWG